MKTIHLKCGHDIQVKTWPSKAGLAKVRHHYKKFHPTRMKKMTKKSLATKRKKGLIRNYRKINTWHLTRDGLRTLCGKVSKNRIHITYYPRKLDSGSWCKKCLYRISRKKGLIKNKCKPNPHPTLIYDRLLGISAHKSHGKFKGENFFHDFKKDTDAVVVGNPDGSLTIKSKYGKRLWKKFKY